MYLLNSSSQLKKAELVVDRFSTSTPQARPNRRCQGCCHIGRAPSAFCHPIVNVGTARFWAELACAHTAVGILVFTKTF